MKTRPALPRGREAMHAEHHADERARQRLGVVKNVYNGLKSLDQFRRGSGLRWGVRGGRGEVSGPHAQSPRLSEAPGSLELRCRAIADETVHHAMGGVHHRGNIGSHHRSARMLEPQEIPHEPRQKQPDHPGLAG